jgi:hypothetical protein
MKRCLPVAAAVAMLFTSCESDPLDVDVSAISVPEVKVLRYEQDLFSIDTTKMAASVAALHAKYGDFSRGFINNLICRQVPDSIMCTIAIQNFVFSPAVGYRAIYDETQKIFPGDMAWLEEDIEGAYKHFRYYFPKRELPKAVYTTMTGIEYNIFNVEGAYGIGLEFYLGEKSFFYDALAEPWPAYRRRVSRQEYIASNFVKAWMVNEFPYDPPKNDLINKMVYEGKLMYLQKALLRDTPDSIITGYPQDKLDWCEANEAKMWATLIEQQKVYSENEEDLNHYTEDGPFTPGFPRESPGKAGNWLGLRIVEAYMAKNPTVTLEDLMNQKDGAAILNKSKYKPKY